MTAYIAFLRGINVGGNKRIQMGDLRDALTTAGLVDPRTLLQSGNVVIESSADTSAVADIVEATIETRFGFHSTVIVRTAEELRAVLAGHPFGEDQLEDGRLAHVCFCRDQPDLDGFEALREAHDGPEEIELLGRELFVYYAEGSGRSRMTNSVIERHLATPVTSRNWNTIEKLEAMLDR